MNNKYEPDVHIRQLVLYIEFGFTNNEICEKMGISHGVFYNWKKLYPEFQKAYEDARASYTKMECSQVEKKLFEKCMGFDYEETEVITELTKTGKRKKASRVKISKKHHVPDLASMKMFLYNRSPEMWSDKNNLNLDITDHEKQREKINNLFEEVKQEKEKSE